MNTSTIGSRMPWRFCERDDHPDEVGPGHQEDGDATHASTNV